MRLNCNMLMVEENGFLDEQEEVKSRRGYM